MYQPWFSSTCCLGWTWLRLKGRLSSSVPDVPPWALVPSHQDWLLNRQCFPIFRNSCYFPRDTAAPHCLSTLGVSWKSLATPSGFRKGTDHGPVAALQPPPQGAVAPPMAPCEKALQVCWLHSATAASLCHESLWPQRAGKSRPAEMVLDSKLIKVS